MYQPLLLVFCISLFGIFLTALTPLPSASIDLNNQSFKKEMLSETISFPVLTFVTFTIPVILIYSTEKNPKKKKLFTFSALVNIIMIVATCEVIKEFVHAPRPDYASRIEKYGEMKENTPISRWFDHDFRAMREGLRSFPSGHTAASFASATFMTIYLIIIEMSVFTTFIFAVVVFGSSIFVGASRISDHRHFLRDVIGGAVFGVLTGVFISYLTEKGLKKIEEEES